MESEYNLLDGAQNFDNIICMNNSGIPWITESISCTRFIEFLI